MDEFVEVVDVTFLVAAPGKDGEPAKVSYTVRPGDAMLDTQPGVVNIVFAPREVLVGGGGDPYRLKSDVVTMVGFIGMERKHRLERKVRPSVAGLLSREVAEIEVLKRKAGIDPRYSS